MEKTHKDLYSMGMSEEDGCIIFVKNGNQILCSLQREDSVRFAEKLLAWLPKGLRRDVKEDPIEADTVSH